MRFYRLQTEHYFNKKTHCVDTDAVNGVTCTRQTVITSVVIRFL